jgi:hypothetical protein
MPPSPRQAPISRLQVFAIKVLGKSKQVLQAGWLDQEKATMQCAGTSRQGVEGASPLHGKE